MTNDFNSRRSGNFKPKLSPEEYAKAKQEEKEAVYMLIDTAISDIVNNPAEFQKYLDTQARMDRYSAANALLIYKQCPEATQLKDFNGWRDDDIRVKKVQRVYLFLILLITQRRTAQRVFPTMSRKHLTFHRQMADNSLHLRSTVTRKILFR